MPFYAENRILIFAHPERSSVSGRGAAAPVGQMGVSVGLATEAQQSLESRGRRLWRGARTHIINSGKAIEAVGTELRYLPPYSPDLNPTELYFSKLKSILRTLAECSVNALWTAIGRIYDAVTPNHCNNFFHKAGLRYVTYDTALDASF